MQKSKFEFRKKFTCENAYLEISFNVYKLKKTCVKETDVFKLFSQPAGLRFEVQLNLGFQD